MGIKEMLSMYVGRLIELIYRDKSCIVGLLELDNGTFYVDRVMVDVDNVYGWNITEPEI